MTLAYATPGATQPGLGGYGPGADIGALSPALFSTSVPAGASLDLQFAGTGALDPRITFTRASTASYFNAAGVMQSAASNAARFDFDPVALTARGLLIEESRTNLLLQSGNLANATSWTTLNQVTAAPTVTANAAVAPDGTTTAAQIVMPAVPSATNASAINQYVSSLTASSPYTYSVWLKGAVGGEQLYLAFQANPSWYVQRVTLTTAWQRFSLTASPSGTAYYMELGTDLRGASPESATSAQTFYAWGAQLELGAFVTSYIPTSGSAATRAADVATMPVGSWLTQGSGTFAVEAQGNGFTPVNYPMFARLDDGTNSNTLDLYAYVSSSTVGTPGADGFNAGTAAWNVTAPSMSLTGIWKSAMAYTATRFAAANNSAVFGSGVPAVAPPANLTTLRFGVSTSVVQGSRYLRRVRYWPRALGNAELQAVTT